MKTYTAGKYFVLYEEWHPDYGTGCEEKSVGYLNKTQAKAFVTTIELLRETGLVTGWRREIEK